jgi:type II secretory pathway predicted ATPase ExeA
MTKSKSQPYPFSDFQRALENLERATDATEEIYLLLTGPTGVGKTQTLNALQERRDRCRDRILYFPKSQRLGASGFMRVVAGKYRVSPSRSHAETFDHVVRVLRDSSQRLLLWFDEAQDLPEETLHEARGLAEADLGGTSNIQVMLCGLPTLRGQLKEHPSLWRRIVVREEINGLLANEVSHFLEHHHGPETVKRMGEKAVDVLFEHSRGAPGVLLPMFRAVLKRSPESGKISPERVDDIVQDWDLK